MEAMYVHVIGFALVTQFAPVTQCVPVILILPVHVITMVLTGSQISFKL
jgi:hypothetical protein